MRTIKIIVFISCLCTVCIHAAAVFAAQSDLRAETVTAAWEIEADREIFTERVVQDVTSGAENPMPLSSFCSADAFQWVAREYHNQINSLYIELDRAGVNVVSGALAASLRTILRVALKTGCEYDGHRVMALHWNYSQLPGSMPLQMHGSGIPIRNFSDAITIGGVTPAPSVFSRGYASHIVYNASYRPNLAVADPLFDRDKIDRFSLFLYREDVPWDFNTTYVFSPLVYCVSIFSIFSHQQLSKTDSTSSKNLSAPICSINRIGIILFELESLGMFFTQSQHVKNNDIFIPIPGAIS